MANSLVQIDTTRNKIADVVGVGGDPGQVEVAGDYVFVTGQDDGTISRIDRSSGELTTSGRFDATGGLSRDGVSSLWSVSTTSDEVTQIDARAFESRDAVPLPALHTLLQEVGNVPRDPAFGFGSVWVAMGKDGTVWRVDPRTERARAIVKVGRGPWGVAIGKDAVWVTNHCDGTVSRIDPQTDEVVATIELGLFPQWLAVAGDQVWVGVAGTKGAQGVFFEECL